LGILNEIFKDYCIIMKRDKIILLLVVLFSGSLSAQKKLLYDETFAGYASYISREFGISCSIPDKFNNLDKYHVGWKVRKDKDKQIGSGYGLIILSNDKKCMVMFSALPHHLSKEDLKMRKKEMLPIYPRSQITAEIKTALGLYYSPGHPLNNDSVKFDFNDYVTIVSGKKAGEMFNADSMYIYNIPGADSVYFIDQ
jgi:hypothetical protein